jgi:hypothetical protein
MTAPQKTEDIHERLANALDALPHGFARTPSADLVAHLQAIIDEAFGRTGAEK